MAKPFYRKVKKLTLAETGYIAGLVDGEGTITLTRRHKAEYRQLAITISNTDYELLKKVLNMVGAGKITVKRMRQSNWIPGYVYEIFSQQGLALLTQIAPYLQTYKQKRAKLILENYNKVTPRNGKYSQELLKRKGEFVKRFFAITPLGKVNERIILPLKI